jgi:hypothetical protein
MVAVLVVGFLVGMRHALEADHVAAVATLAARAASLGERVRLAAMWGVGHAGTLFVLGGTVLALGLSLPDHVARAFEGAVAVMLVLLGVDVLRRLRLRSRGAGGGVHEAHGHAARLLPRALLVGSVHGLAGSAALVVLSLELTRSTAQALSYLGAFGVGSTAGMAALSLAISLPLGRWPAPLGTAWDVVEGALGIVTIVLGSWMAALVLGA